MKANVTDLYEAAKNYQRVADEAWQAYLSASDDSAERLYDSYWIAQDIADEAYRIAMGEPE